MRTNEYRGRTYDASSTVVKAGEYRGVFDVDSTSEEVTDGVINEATGETFPTREAAEQAADTAARCWIDSEADKR
jgi:hypothetical protein